MRLVDDERVVGAEQPVALDLGKQDAVRHELDQRGVAHLVGEAHLVADRPAQLGAELLGDPVRDRTGRQPSGLGVSDRPAYAAAQLEADLGQLGGLARPGLPRHHHDLVVTDRREDLVLRPRHRELGWIAHRRHCCPPVGDASLGPREGGHRGRRPAKPRSSRWYHCSSRSPSNQQSNTSTPSSWDGKSSSKRSQALHLYAGLLHLGEQLVEPRLRRLELRQAAEVSGRAARAHCRGELRGVRPDPDDLVEHGQQAAQLFPRLRHGEQLHASSLPRSAAAGAAWRRGPDRCPRRPGRRG